MNNLFSAKNTQEFLKIWFQSLKQKKTNMTFDAIAKKTGYASRSFVRQVIAGEKPLTAKSLPRFLAVMNLDKDHENLFKLLFEKENLSLNYSNKSFQTIDSEIETIRQKFKIKKTKKITSKVANAASLRKATILYPLLSQTHGTSIEELSLRAQLSVVDCEIYLETLIKEQYVLKSDQLYFATERLLQLQTTDQIEILKSYVRTGLFLFHDALNLPNENTKEQFLFRAQYSIRQDQIEEFKNKLRNVLVEFVETTESDDSKKVVNLVCGLF